MPPSSLISEPTVILTVNQFLDAVDKRLAAQSITTSIATTNLILSQSYNNIELKEGVSRASKLEYKTVNEVYTTIEF